jgi:hypothetical protein
MVSATLTSAAAPRGAKIDPSDLFFTNGNIPHLSIQIDEAAVAALRLHPRAYVKATVKEGPVVYQDVGIHLKGNYGTFKGLEGKPSLTLNFDKFVRGQKFHGLDKLHLNNSTSDPSYLTELLCRELFRAAGVPVGRASHARVELNGREAGLYVLVEGYDKSFLRPHFKNANGNLYDSEFMHDITEPLRRGSGEGPNDHADLRALAEAAQEFPMQVQHLTPALSPSDAEREESAGDGVRRREARATSPFVCFAVTPSFCALLRQKFDCAFMAVPVAILLLRAWAVCRSHAGRKGES